MQFKPDIFIDKVSVVDLVLILINSPTIDFVPKNYLYSFEKVHICCIILFPPPMLLIAPCCLHFFTLLACGISHNLMLFFRISHNTLIKFVIPRVYEFRLEVGHVVGVHRDLGVVEIGVLLKECFFLRAQFLDEFICG